MLLIKFTKKTFGEEYVCHHSDRNKAVKSDSDRIIEHKHKATGCKQRLYVSIHRCTDDGSVLFSVPDGRKIAPVCHFCPSTGTDKSGKLTLFSVPTNISSPDGVT